MVYKRYMKRGRNEYATKIKLAYSLLIFSIIFILSLLFIFSRSIDLPTGLIQLTGLSVSSPSPTLTLSPSPIATLTPATTASPILSPSPITTITPEPTASPIIIEPIIEYSPQNLNIDIYDGTSIEFKIQARDDSYVKGEIIELNVKWYLNSELIKEEYSRESIKSDFSNKFFIDSSPIVVKAEVSNGYYTKEIIWNVNVIKMIPVRKGCEEKWLCEWSLCDSSGKSHAKNCRDLNMCGTTLKKPYAKECECVPDWICTAWTECEISYDLRDVLNLSIKQGKQKRTCIDISNCYITQQESRPCKEILSLEINKILWCNEPYIEIYDTEKKGVVARLKEKTGKTKTLDLEFFLTESRGYCKYCYNGVRDGDEEGIDCGGSCQPCL